MAKKNMLVLCAAIFLGVVLLAGCQTSKAIGNGLAEGFTDGIYKDTKGACGWVSKTDAWIKKNLW